MDDISLATTHTTGLGLFQIKQLILFPKVEEQV